MALHANSYGSTDQIGALVPQHANDGGKFSASTNPTLTTVELECDYISALLNMLLAAEGFAIPVTDVNATTMLGGFVNRMVAEVVKAIRGGGRYGVTIKQGRKTLNQFMMEEIKDYISTVADGLEGLGVDRSHGTLTGISFREYNDNGDATFPLFQREGFGNHWENWDSTGIE